MGTKKGEEEKKKKKEKNCKHYSRFFLLFLHAAGKILIFIKKNMENTKYILTVRSNSV